ncbi:aminodeoxychorismate synthase component I [Actinomarinicola tropica]|uniref:aminodeoxychorismate synthase n=1 Tax=Actinomarinicola tropica TaxID=2789776 RepID=A0A5Q2RCE7_9ACTN|nr:aminodeoxychorismate synthase component I [Actinomarinicola tropica]QGG94518.1 aminodeoxychorismate synthase component I [Actinomarinicola tropica]
MTSTVVRAPISSTLSPVEALRTLRADRHPVALHGRWFDAPGVAVLASEPVRVTEGPGGPDPFDALDAPGPAIAPDQGAAIGGGWFGYLGYRAGRLVERLPDGPHRPHPLPDWWLGWYDHVLRHDPRSGWWFEALWTEERAAALAERREVLVERLSRPPLPACAVQAGPFAQAPDDAGHRHAVARTIEHIGAGDVYQANVCLRLEARLDGDPLDLWARGVEALDPPHAAFVDVGDGRAVASLSPERFLRRRGRSVSSVPIKGTRPRVADPDRSARAHAELRGSTKERAENVMIVDLVRNDLGRVCRPGSIAVPRLWQLEPHPGVWHLVSEVVGHLRDDVGDGGLLRASFPPGSVTGAPKIRAMEVIAEVESTAREVYTGAVGAVSPLAGADWNVAIRTFETAGDAVWLGAGGGIVADSDPDAELEECRTKARPLLAAIGAELSADSPDR